MVMEMISINQVAEVLTFDQILIQSQKHQITHPFESSESFVSSMMMAEVDRKTFSSIQPPLYR